MKGGYGLFCVGISRIQIGRLNMKIEWADQAVTCLSGCDSRMMKAPRLDSHCVHSIANSVSAHHSLL